MYYAGIGSRTTPVEIQHLMYQVAKSLAKQGWILRSGAASGADQAFEKGCDKICGKKEIYLPWAAFEGSSSPLVVQPGKAFEIAEKFHPYWHNLSQGARKLQARNSHQVLGQDLSTPSRFILCYTKNGSGQGGTGQAVRIARAHNIPIFDFGKYKTIDEIKDKYIEFYKCLSRKPLIKH